MPAAPQKKKGQLCSQTRHREQQVPNGLTIPHLFPSHQADVDASGAGDSCERDEFAEERARCWRNAQARDELRQADGDGARGYGCGGVGGCSLERVSTRPLGVFGGARETKPSRREQGQLTRNLAG